MPAFAAILLLLWPALVRAHGGEITDANDLWTAWSFDPGTVVPLLGTGVLFFRGAREPKRVSRRQLLYFWCGYATLAIALISPLHPLGEVLFSAHMVQHEALMLIAAPLLVLARPLVPFLWALPIRWRVAAGNLSKTPVMQRGWRILTSPAVAWSVHAAAIWVWHIPVLFQATLTSEFAHSCQHLSFLGSALLFWWSLFHGRKSARGGGVPYLFTTAVHTGILGALLTFAPTPWYPAYASSVRAWGWSPLADQQAGGLIMWVPASLVYLGAAIWLMLPWLRDSAAEKLERYAN